MSTYFFLRCLQHDPALESHEEITQHDDWNLENAVRMAAGAPVLELDPGYVGSYFYGNAIRFLNDHLTCPLDVISETGEVRPIPGREVPA